MEAAGGASRDRSASRGGGRASDNSGGSTTTAAITVSGDSSSRVATPTASEQPQPARSGKAQSALGGGRGGVPVSLSGMASQAHRQILPRPAAAGRSSVAAPALNSRVMAACEICRTKKAKCDGQRPRCSRCAQRDLRCEYEVEPDTTRYNSLKRKYQLMEEEHAELAELFDILRRRPYEEALSIFGRIRSEPNLRSTLAFIKDGDLLMQTRMPTAEALASVLPPTASSVENLLNVWHGKAYPLLVPLAELGAERGQARKSILEARPGERNGPSADEIEKARSVQKAHWLFDERLGRVKASRWTTVTDDDTTVANLLSFYFSWEHSTLRIFDEDLFLDHLVEEKTEYCSEMLVNAILMVATCGYRAIDCDEAERLTHRFYEETMRHWRALDGRAHLLQVPTSILLLTWCSAHSRDKPGSLIFSYGAAVARDLGLFRKAHRENASPELLRGREVIAWGIFNWQTLQAFYMHLEAQFSRPPPYAIPYEARVRPSRPFPLLLPPEVMDHHGLLFKALSELFVILNECMNLRDSMAPMDDKATAFQIAKLLYLQMLKWAADLPHELLRGPTCSPAVLNLHLLYHGFIVQVFRPFAGDGGSDGSFAHGIMLASLAQIKRLFYLNDYRFGGPPFVGPVMGPVHFLLFAVLEERSKAAQPDPELEFYLVSSAKLMNDVGLCFPVLRLILYSLISNAKQQKTSLPAEIEVMFRVLDAQLFGQMDVDRIQSRYPVDLNVAVTDPEKAAIDTIVKATYDLKLGEQTAGEAAEAQA